MKKVILLSFAACLVTSNLNARVVTQEYTDTTIDTVSYKVIDKGSRHPGGGGGTHHSGGGNHHSSGGGKNKPKDRRTAIWISSYVQFVESEADKKMMNFYVSLNKRAKSDLAIHYKITDARNGFKIGEDIVRPSGVVTIKEGQKRAKISIRVKNDKLLEDAEYFKITLLKPSNNYKFWRRKAEGVILDDELKIEKIDTNGKYSIIEHASNDNNIKTKIVNRDFKIDIKAQDGFEVLSNKKINTDKICSDKITCYKESYGKDGVAEECTQECTIKTTVTLEYSDSMNIDKVLLHTYEGYDPTAKVCINERAKIAIANDLNLTSGKLLTLSIKPKISTPCAWFEAKGRSDIDLNTSSRHNFVGKSDTFAIRPLKFHLPKNLISKAGLPKSIIIDAFDNSGAKDSKGYNEIKNSSFNITATAVKSGCSYNNDINTTDLKAFSDGKLNGKISYDNVGELKVKISEIDGAEFAKIDTKDTPKNQRFITSDEAVIKFVPDHFDANIIYSNDHTAGNVYSFYSNDLSHGPKWNIGVYAKNAKGDTVTNYDPSCVGTYAGSVDLNMTFNLGSSGDLSKLKSSEGDIVLNPAPNQDATINTTIDGFVNGQASKNIRVNFGRNLLTPYKPALLNTKEIKIADSFGAKYVDHNKYPLNGVTYQYMRAFVQSPVSVVGKKVLTTNIDYEVYNPLHNAKGVVGTSQSGDRDWSRVNYDPTSGKMSVAITGVKYSSANRSQPSTPDDKTLRVTTNNLPEKNVVYLQPTSDFQYLSSKISAQVGFFPNNATWTGRGKVGQTIDTTIAKPAGFKKLGW